MKTELEHYFDRLWPICRSITGDGLRDSLRIMQELVPLELTEVPTGTQVFDWEIPKEWNIEEAYILAPDGRKICDFKVNNLHVVNYSAPVERSMSFMELDAHLHHIESVPDAIPYITSYYKETWGFCLSYTDYKALSRRGEYKVCIKSSLTNGSLTYGDFVLKGETDEEVLFSTYLCHPSMANNELSGPLVQAFLYRLIASMPRRRYTYRFVFAPETIGIIAYLHKHCEHLKKQLKAGYVLTCCGDSGALVYKKSKHGGSPADKVAQHVLKHQKIPFELMPFSVGGSDERQYCSPGFNLPVGSLTRSMYQRYKEYHTSLDNKSFISFEAMEQTVHLCFDFVRALELNETVVNTVPYCEPQMGKRGLYPSSVNPADAREMVHRRMHLLSFADGEHDLIDIADRRPCSVFDLEEHVAVLKKSGLLR